MMKSWSWTIRLAVAVAAMLIMFAGYQAVKHFFSAGAKTESRLGKNETKAAIESGSDAVETLNNRQFVDQANERIVQETRNDVQKQTTGTGVTAAGRRGLCRLPGNRSKPECLQPASPK